MVVGNGSAFGYHSQLFRRRCLDAVCVALQTTRLTEGRGPQRTRGPQAKDRVG